MHSLYMYLVVHIKYCTVLFCTILYYTVLYCTILHCTVLYYTTLYYTVLYCTVLFYTTLYVYLYSTACLKANLCLVILTVITFDCNKGSSHGQGQW